MDRVSSSPVTTETTYDRQIWMKVNRIDQEASGVFHCPSANQQGSEDVENGTKSWCVHLRTDMGTESVKSLLRALFHIPGHNLLLRVRNSRGNLIPLNCYMADNTRSEPHTLEVVKINQHRNANSVTSDYNQRFRDLTKRKLDYNMHRIENLENELTNLDVNQDGRANEEVAEIQKKLKFLHQRFDIAEGTTWKGMFKRHPFW